MKKSEASGVSFPRLMRVSGLAAAAALLGGCDPIVLKPAGDVAQQQGNLLVTSTLLMLLIIIPVMALTILFAWRYRAGNRDARYDPDWDHSMQLELVIWAAPLLIIICLGALTWVGTHLLDPYRPIARIAPGRAVAADHRPLDVNVVALDWKWLFIYPEYGVATVNELVAPVDRPIRFRITSTSVMNSFYIPALAGQIYAMPGMETKLHAVANAPGSWPGFSANYSGAGFSHMRFGFRAVSDADFDAWVSEAKSGGRLDRGAFLQLERPSENVPVTRYGNVDPALFDLVVNMCVDPGKMCAGDMMKIDGKGGLGLEGVHNVRQLTYDKFGRDAEGRRVVAALCAPPESSWEASYDVKPVNITPLKGANLPKPGAASKTELAAAATRSQNS